MRRTGVFSQYLRAGQRTLDRGLGLGEKSVLGYLAAGEVALLIMFAKRAGVITDAESGIP